MYEVYLGKMLCPIAPSKIDTKIKNQNKTITLINDVEVSVLKAPGLSEISLDLLLPNVKYPFAVYKSGFVNAKTFLDEIERLKVEKEPFYFKVIRSLPSGKNLFNTEIKVSLEDYTIKEDSKNGFDFVVSIKLKQYKYYTTKIAKVISENTETNETTVTTETVRPTENSPTPKGDSTTTYTVVKGDSLWNIAKKYYGDGSKYPAILNANKDKISNANLIYPGQVLIIPNASEVKAYTNVSNSSGTKPTASNGTIQNNTSLGYTLLVHNNNDVFSSYGDVTVTYYNVNQKYTTTSANKGATVTVAKGTKANVTIKPKSGYTFVAMTSGTWSKADKGSQGTVYTCAVDKNTCSISITWERGGLL